MQEDKHIMLAAAEESILHLYALFGYIAVVPGLKNYARFVYIRPRVGEAETVFPGILFQPPVLAWVFAEINGRAKLVLAVAGRGYF